MFCPICGFEERETNQFCRACGSGLSVVRAAIETPDKITHSAVLARSEVGKAFASKIREADASNLPAIVETVLPEIEKFLESPEEKRLRRVRNGSVVASIGFGVSAAFSLIAFYLENELIILAGLGFITFVIGISLLLNGLFFTVSRKEIANKSDEADGQRSIDGGNEANLIDKIDSNPGDRGVGSVVESTTRNLTKHNAE